MYKKINYKKININGDLAQYCAVDTLYIVHT